MMYKLIVCSVLFVVTFAAPSHVDVAAPLALPAAVSHQSRVDVYSKPAYIASPTNVAPLPVIPSSVSHGAAAIAAPVPVDYTASATPLVAPVEYSAPAVYSAPATYSVRVPAVTPLTYAANYAYNTPTW